MILSTWNFFLYFSFHITYIIMCSEKFFVFFLVRKKIVFFETINVKIYSFVAKLYQKMRFFLFRTYYYAHETKNKKWKFRSFQIKFDRAVRILRRLSQKNVFFNFLWWRNLTKKFNRIPSDREFFSLSNGTNQFSIYTLSREKNSIFKKFWKSRLYPKLKYFEPYF